MTTINIFYNKNLKNTIPDSIPRENVDFNVMMKSNKDGMLQILKIIELIPKKTKPKINFQEIDTSEAPDIYALYNNALYKYNDVITLLIYVYNQYLF